jgi:outer membrane protein assembly factor BamE
MQPQTRSTSILVALALALSACSVYRPEVRQGNFLEPDKFAQLKPGMTREQVRFLVGPPMIADAFHNEQWDYYFTLETQFVKAGTVKRHYIVRFDGDYVTSVEEQKPLGAGAPP